MCAQIDCSKPPVRIALYEVQLRLRLDDRFEVRSLDGVVDVGLHRFVTQSGALDLVRYVEAEKVDLILDLPRTHPPDRPSLWEIYQRTAGGAVRVDCSRFERRELKDWPYSRALSRTQVSTRCDATQGSLQSKK